jgi:hypothetical protein
VAPTAHVQSKRRGGVHPDAKLFTSPLAAVATILMAAVPSICLLSLQVMMVMITTMMMMI